jgi:hypothetical protein
MAKKPMKGTAGKKTGGAARKAIRAKVSKGCTMAEIGKMAKRSPGTISAILSGEIKNPPKNLAGNVRKAKCKKK